MAWVTSIGVWQKKTRAGRLRPGLFSWLVNHFRAKVAPRRNQRTARAMGEADRLLHNILEGGDIVGKDGAGRIVIQVAVDRRDFEMLMTFGAVEVEVEVESECGGDDEPFDCPPVSPCWFEEARPAFTGIPLH